MRQPVQKKPSQLSQSQPPSLFHPVIHQPQQQQQQQQQFRPKRMFQAVDLFGESETAPSAPAAQLSFGSGSFGKFAPEDSFLSVQSFGGMGDSPSPPPAANLLPRDLLSSSGAGFSSESPTPGYSSPSQPSAVRLVKSEPAVAVQSLFGGWKVDPVSTAMTADSLISQLRAPQTLSSKSNEELFSGLSWINSASGANDLLFEVALEDDPTLMGVVGGEEIGIDSDAINDMDNANSNNTTASSILDEESQFSHLFPKEK